MGFDGKAFARNLSNSPGVYRMLDNSARVLYVGKAKNLHNRVSSYFSSAHSNRRIAHMVSQVNAIEISVTRTETEALLLENQLIKTLKPRYNVLLRDDKSYPYIYCSNQQEFPRLSFHRGAQRQSGRYFGPFASAHAVRNSLQMLQKVFRIRQCDDSFFTNRSRPCLQYQIKRCTAPCVGLINADDYKKSIQQAEMFLDGRQDSLTADMVATMEIASNKLEFERAATIRDQIAILKRVQEKQYVSGEGKGDIDVVAVALVKNIACIQIVFIRNGHHLGNRAFYPKVPKDIDESSILDAFLSQYYGKRDAPHEIILSHEIESLSFLVGVFSSRVKRKVHLQTQPRAHRAKWLESALTNASQALARHLASNQVIKKQYEALQSLLMLDEMPERLECFDISHTMGEATVASCVVFGPEGAIKSDYRRFNITDIEPGDDYAAIYQAVFRRYSRIKKGEGQWPDIVFIDGGQNQLNKAHEAMQEIQVSGPLLVGVAKGTDRRPGQERLFLQERVLPLALQHDSPGLYLIQSIRDEAHRFAISGHRQRRAKTRQTSPLEGIEGVGAKRRQQLLRFFGGLQELRRAGIEEITRVPGISQAIAERIYDRFQEKG